MANVYDVGQYITELVPTVDTMKLYKLCYFSQGWKLAWTGCLLFQEPLQAWANSPIPIVLCDRSKPGGDSTNLTTTELCTVESVVDFYRDKDFAELSRLSQSKAWKEARLSLPDNAHSQEVLSVTTMREEFTDLLHSTPNVPSCPPGALIPENYSLETALAAIAEIEKTWGGTLALLATH